MPPETVKEERKRKRTTQDAQDGSVQKTKKIKSEGKRNGAQLNGTTVDVNISSPAPALESADQVVSTDRKQKNRKKSSAKSENATASTSREEVTESTVVVKLDISEQGKKAKKKKKAKSKESKQDEEHVVNGDAAEEQQAKKADTKDNAEKLRKFDHKQQKLIKKFETLEIQSRDGKVIGGELRELLKQAQKLVNKHKLDGDDELVKLLNRYDDARRDLWQMSRPVGGRYINHDPLFSKDEKHIILATANSIHVYEAESSLLLRTMYAHNISCYSLSSIHSHHLYVGNVYGDIHRFDWTTGQDLGTLSAGKGVCVRSAAPIQLRNTDEEVVFTIETLPKPGKKSRKTQSGGGDTPVDVLAIRKAPWEDGDEARQVLYRGNGRLQHLRILDHGKLVIIAGENDMVVGDLSGNLDFSGTTLADLAGRYRWRHLSCNQAISCLDAFLRVAASQDKSGRAKEGRSYSVAIGNAEGKVLVYDNIIEQLDILEDQGTNAAPRFRTLRWQREAPNTVKWSKDGNYLISGGKETVLCLWQLETGRRQDLPHLTAPVVSLTISPSGTSYGIQLADNSIMVLSTAELQPKTHIAGLQSLCISTSYIRTNNGLLSSAKDAYAAIPLVSNPRSSKDFLLAVPVNQQITKTTTLALPAPFLQTYDLQAGRHVSRQALTRNLVTETNIDPDWNKIEIPNVTLMQISHDGNWLATVEEWTPPTHALQHLASNKHDVEVERRKRRETYLKIWHWNEESNTWALNTRVDKPHADESHEEANRTFHLVAHPTRAGFATIGEDSAIRIWRPRKRDAETMWHAKSVFRLERSAATADETSDFPLPSTPIIGCLAYSNDGSVLAVSTQNNVQRQSRVVQLLNAETGEVRFAENGLAVGHVVSMGFLDRYLIILSDELRVWDLVIGNMVFARALSGTRMSLSQRLATTHLAISTRSATFAVAGFDIVEGHSGSTVLVFKPTTTEPIYRFDLNYGAVSALASLLDTGGYVVLNSLAEIRTLITHNVPITGKLPKAIIKAKAENQVAELEDEEMEEVKEATATRAERRAPTLALENDRQVLKSEQLAQVFATGSAGFGLPSVKEMFDGVAKLFAVKAE